MSRHPLYARLVWLRRKIFRLVHWHGRVLVWLMALAVLAAGGAAAWLQWWFFPHLEDYRPRVRAELSQRIGRPVEIGRIDGGWRAGLPYLDFRQVALHQADGRLALKLDQVEATLSWWPLLIGDLRFDRLTLRRPDLQLVRAADGTISLAGLALNHGSGDGALGNWILRQHDIAIVDGRVGWRDDMRKAPLLVLDHVDFKLENLLFGRHATQLSATPPASLAKPFNLSVTWQGDEVAHFSDWRGSLKTDLHVIDLVRWRDWLPYPVEVRQGNGQLELALDFHGAQLTEVDATLALRDTSLRLAPELAWLDVDGLSGRLRWSDREGERELNLGDLKLSAEGGKLLDGSQASLLLHRGGGGQLDVSGLTLPALAGLPPALPMPNAVRQALQGMQPSGRIDRLSAAWQGDWREPRSYTGRVAFTGLGLRAPAPWPTVGPLDGELGLDEKGGRLAVRGQRFQLVSDELFEQPLALDRIRLAADWRREGAAWVVNLRDFAAGNADLEANATATWRWPGHGLGNLQLAAQVPRLTAGKVAAYLPNAIGAETRHWLRDSLTAGEARDARFTLNGPLADFPFVDGKTGNWEVVTQAHAVTLDYAPDWPGVRELNGQVRIKGGRLTIAAAGKILDTSVERADAVIDDLETSTAIRINGAVSGPSAEFFRFIAQSPLDATLDGLGKAARASGNGQLDLKLDIPFENADATRVTGRYRFTGNRLQIGEAMPELSELNGELGFSEQGISGRGLQAKALGGSLRADVGSGVDGAVQILANGRADSGAAARRYGLPLAERISGSTDFRVQLDLPKHGWQMNLEAPLRETRIDLPAPFGKPTGEPRPLKLMLDAGDSLETWQVSLGNVLNVDLSRTPGPAGWRIERGGIHIGSGKPTPAGHGLWLTANLPELALDPWLDLLQEGGMGGAATGGTAPLLTGVELRTDRLTMAGNQLDDLSLRAVPQADGAWQLSAVSKQVEGRADWSPAGKGRLHARLGRLVLPLPEVAGAAATAGKRERQLPALDVVAEDFRYRDHALGRLDVKAQQQRENWLIDSLTLVNPDGRLNMQGVWQAGGEAGVTRVKLDIASDNVGKLLGRFGYPETMRRGGGALRGELVWRGSPLAPDYPSMSGNFNLKASNGQFAKIEPGVGRLLGILSLQSLQRRLSLDFRDVFSEGFAFDRIEGDSKISKGVVSTDNLVIVGPAAQVLFRGEADIARETQKLRVRIVPTVGDSLAVGAGLALANPVVGVGAFLLQRVLKDPLGQLIAYEYDITGQWDDPQVTRVGATPTK
ncbi:TIGR02099 family protein [Chitinimonas arctica]|uniref:TIGR02099 family protein n=1 Tax=Chitinimonas arctica TaxID=2594795 RepID=A0A516SJQ9_9NEIS|nr:YhdP family protein [Chitinimonas arctica]QDQ28386.1 TIGR02099 family protein [Chitinimonas arctica]